MARTAINLSKSLVVLDPVTARLPVLPDVSLYLHRADSEPVSAVERLAAILLDTIRSEVKPAVGEVQVQHVFEQVQRQLHARGPRVVAPRITTGPVLLTGLAICASCRGAMTSRTGTSKTGALYYYYTCSTCMRKGKVACKGRSIRMDKLDALVSVHLAER